MKFAGKSAPRATNRLVRTRAVELHQTAPRRARSQHPKEPLSTRGSSTRATPACPIRSIVPPNPARVSRSGHADVAPQDSNRYGHAHLACEFPINVTITKSKLTHRCVGLWFASEEAERLRAVRHQHVLSLLVVVEHHLVRLAADDGSSWSKRAPPG
jgi:hypothetical protein